MGEKWRTISVPETLYERLDRQAAKEGISLAFYVRRMAERELSTAEKQDQGASHSH